MSAGCRSVQSLRLSVCWPLVTLQLPMGVCSRSYAVTCTPCCLLPPACRRVAAGDVDAPIAVPIVAAIVVTAAITFAVPAYLNRGEPCFGDVMGQHSSLPRGVHPSQYLKQRWWLKQHSDLFTAALSTMCISVGALWDVVMSPPPPPSRYGLVTEWGSLCW